MTSVVVLAVAGLLLVLLAGVVVAFVLVGRSGPRRTATRGPVAAPGMSANRAEAASLLLRLTDDEQHHSTELEFARLQLPAEIVTDYAAAISEAAAAADALSRAVAETRDSQGRGPSGTRAAGVLATAVSQAKGAAQRLAIQEAVIAEARRRIDPV